MHKIRANEVLYGGAAGPGKSHALRHEGYDWCQRVPGLQVYLFRRTFPELEKNHIIPALGEFSPKVCKWNDKDSRFDFFCGSKLFLCHCQYEKDVFKYQGSEIDLLLIDELTTFTEFIYDYLRGRVRPTMDIPAEFKWRLPGIVCASNPGGVGHAFAKKRWVDFCQPLEPKQASKREGGMVRAYIPGRLEDNPTLTRRDPEYIHRLDALPEPYRTAYKEGDWNVFMGQAFSFDRAVHVIRPTDVPENAPVFMTYDWGFGKPFSIGWWWVDPDGRLLRFSEWYGWNGTANQGIRLTDSQVAMGIIDRERRFNKHIKVTRRYAGGDCFQKRPDYKGGGQGPSTAHIFRAVGEAHNHTLVLFPADTNRERKVKQFHERLRVPEDGGAPMMLIYENCEHFIRTIPLLQFDDHRVEDVDTEQEDHVYDEACHAVMTHPLHLKWDIAGEAPPTKPPQNATEVAWLEHAEIMSEAMGLNLEW